MGSFSLLSGTVIDHGTALIPANEAVAIDMKTVVFKFEFADGEPSATIEGDTVMITGNNDIGPTVVRLEGELTTGKMFVLLVTTSVIGGDLLRLRQINYTFIQP